MRPGAECVITLKSGAVIRGLAVGIDADSIDVVMKKTPGNPETTVTVLESEIASVGQVVGVSKAKRGWVGAGLGALASLPLSMSMVGDAMLIGGLLGAWIGRNTGDSRIEIVMQR